MMTTDTHSQMEQDLTESSDLPATTEQIVPAPADRVDAATVDGVEPAAIETAAAPDATAAAEPPGDGVAEALIEETPLATVDQVTPQDAEATAAIETEVATESQTSTESLPTEPPMEASPEVERPEDSERVEPDSIEPIEVTASTVPLEQESAERSAETEASGDSPPEAVAALPELEASSVAIDVAGQETPVATPAAEPPPVEDEAQRLARLDERAAALAVEVEAAPNKATFLGRVRRMLAQVPDDAGEQAAAIRGRLGELEQQILAQIDERRKQKEAIVVRAEELSGSNEWKATGEAMRGLFDQWKAIGSAGHEAEDALWQRFQAARDTFSQRRNEWFEGRQKEWAVNREKKEALCVRAEELSDSTEWRSTADAMRGLMAEWKTVGSAGRESDDALWSRFRAAQQIFFDRRSATYDENRRRKEEICAQAEQLSDSTDWRGTADTLKGLQATWREVGPVGSREIEDRLWNRFRSATQAFFERRGSSFAERDRDEADNLRRKEELCVAAEALAVAADPVAATEEAKALQAEWKTIGPVRRDRGDALWGRFRGACDRVFENAVNERARRQVAWSTKMREALLRKQEQLERLEEAIAHDEATVQRWQASLETRPDDGVAAKIADTTARIGEKRARAADLKASIDDIQVKMKS
jgi:hypothetical protein